MINNVANEKRFNFILNPSILFWIYFFVYYCVSGYFFTNKNLFLIFICIIIISYELVLSKNKLNISSFSIMILIFPLFGLISSLYNKDSMLFSNTSQTLSLIFLYLSIILFIRNLEKRTIELVNIIFWTGFIGGPIIGIYQMITKEYLYTLPMDSIYKENSFIDTIISTATQYNANLVALQIAVTLFLGLFLKEYKYIQSKLFDTVILTTLIALCFTVSRTTIASVIIVFFIYYFKTLKRKTFADFFKNYVFSFLTLIIVILSIKYLSEIVYETLDLKRLIQIKSIENADIRFMQWNGVLEIMKSSGIANLIIGHGYNYINLLGNITGYAISTHNTFLEQLVKNGFFSAVIFLYIFIILIKNSFVLQKRDDRYLPILLGGIVIFVSLQMISSIGIDSLLLPMIFIKHMYRVKSQIEQEK